MVSAKKNCGWLASITGLGLFGLGLALAVVAFKAIVEEDEIGSEGKGVDVQETKDLCKFEIRENPARDSLTSSLPPFYRHVSLPV